MSSLYLDTSVLGGYFDDEWKDPTQELWRQMEAGQWRFFTSLVAAEELAQAPERVRDLFRRSFTPENVFDLTEEMDQLAVAESRKWREAASQKLNAMSRADRLAYLKSLGERVRAEMRSRQIAQPAAGA